MLLCVCACVKTETCQQADLTIDDLQDKLRTRDLQDKKQF
jgi:uncharacterized membrane protein YcaP (DUF421 family)